VDDVTRVERVQPLALGQVPQQGNMVFPSGGAQRAVRAHSDGVDVTAVTLESAAKLAIGEVPHLDTAVPGAGDDRRLVGIRREADARNPAIVALGAAKVAANCVLAFAEGVPQLDGAITGRGHDLAVVGGEGDGEDVLLVADEAAGSFARGEIPETEIAVPGPRERELAVGAEDDVLDEVGVACKAAEWDAVVGGGGAVPGGLDGVPEVPDQQRLVAGGGDDEIGVVDGGGDRRHHAVVAAHHAGEHQGLLCAGHGGGEG